jgi:hypothetical protein
MVVKGEHRFVSFVKVGAAAAGLSPALSTLRLGIEGADDVTVSLATHGPGDVMAIDASAVTRLVPRPGASDFEPDHLAAIELAHPALPWMLSPPRTPLLPWLALIVVEERPGVARQRAGSIDVLDLAAPADLARELPDLAQAWAWVHAHGVGPAGAELAASAFAHSAEPTSARLLCPRRLEPRRRYHAALVPVFAAGVQAALGLPVTAAFDALAWDATTPLPLRLPCYRAWSFSTGEGGDFAALARALRPRRLDAAAGRAELDASTPGWGIADVPGRRVAIGGVLRPAGTEPPAAPPDAIALGAAIGELIDDAAVAAPGEVPVLAPPLYGAHATGATRTDGPPGWIARYNRDVRLRVAAGLGTELVRREQDALVEAAWQEIGEAEAANRVLRHAEVAAAIGERLRARYVEPLPDGELIQATRPAHRRMRLADGGLTLRAELAASAVPTRAVSAPFRRLTRPTGRASRRLGDGALAGTLVERTNRTDKERIDPAPPHPVLHGLAALDAISEAEHIQPRFNSARPGVIDESAASWKARPELRVATRALARSREPHIPPEEIDWTPDPPSTIDEPDPVQIDQFAAAARRHQRYLVEHLGAIDPPRPRRPLAGGALAAVRRRYAEAASPRASLVPILAARLEGVAPAAVAALRPIAITPAYERPLLPALIGLGAGHVLPGADDVPADTIAMLAPDHDAVAACLLGANHELAAELRWRGVPIAPDATPLRRFWDRISRGADGALVRDPDIPPVRDWPDAGPPPTPVGLVLLVRGELIRRYRNAIVTLVEARWDHRYRVPGKGTPRAPLFQLAFGDDAALYGFDLDAAAVVGGDAPGGPAGWYVVIEEHPQEPRFGLVAGDLRGGTHLRVDGPLAALHPDGDVTLRWGVDAAQTAAILLRRPTRIAIHGSRLVPAEGG